PPDEPDRGGQAREVARALRPVLARGLHAGRGPDRAAPGAPALGDPARDRRGVQLGLRLPDADHRAADRLRALLGHPRRRHHGAAPDHELRRDLRHPLRIPRPHRRLPGGHGREPAPGPRDPQLRHPGVHAALRDHAERVPHQLPLRGRPAAPGRDAGPGRRAGLRGRGRARVPARLPAGEPPARRDRARLVRRGRGAGLSHAHVAPPRPRHGPASCACVLAPALASRPRAYVPPSRHARPFPRCRPLADGSGGMGGRVGERLGGGCRPAGQISSPAVIASASSTPVSSGWEPTAVRWRRPSTSISIDSTSVPAASRYGAPAVVAAARGPATAGATAPPRNRTPEYAELATPRGRSVASMTVSVSAVFMIPSSSPPTTISTIIPVIELWARLIAAISTVSSPRVVSSVGIRPSRRVSSGATNTEVIASPVPQPKKTPPMASAPNSRPCAAAAASSGNGE